MSTPKEKDELAKIPLKLPSGFNETVKDMLGMKPVKNEDLKGKKQAKKKDAPKK